MQTHLICYADDQMTISQQLCIKSAKEIGKVDQTWVLRPTSIDTAFYNRHKHILTAPQRGGGYGFWLWKPYIVNQAIMALPDGDILIYADSGVEFIRPVDHLTARMEEDILLFSNGHRHIDWCKAEVLTKMLVMPPNWDAKQQVPAKQVQASVMLFRVNEYTRDFCARWLAWSCIPGFIDDSITWPQLPEFREHRNDQSILTNLAIEDDIKLHHWPAQYWQDKKGEYPGDDYPQMFYHHRYRNTDWKNWATSQGLGSLTPTPDWIQHFMKQPKNM